MSNIIQLYAIGYEYKVFNYMESKFCKWFEQSLNHIHFNNLWLSLTKINANLIFSILDRFSISFLI